ncbi:hypothetical protein [Paraburkholderia caribensis]|uniref:hypothetical protein n=1 Tax=Paraburkholderia caribensis TaxID=75105 RepID=UPI00078C5E75|nr:hypothetical protein [Paraburkholderia caribensis]AMV47741.1 hypothetical protein ATN79_44550 [Paraburkholderia caribensis]
MKVENNRRRGGRTRWAFAIAVSTLLAIAATWLSAIVDHPINTAIVTEMMSPECRKVGRIVPGSVLFASPPDDDICRSYFLYRATDHNAASDVTSYTSFVLHERVAEFRKRIGYVFLLGLFASGVIVGGAALLRRFFRKLPRR